MQTLFYNIPFIYRVRDETQALLRKEFRSARSKKETGADLNRYNSAFTPVPGISKIKNAKVMIMPVTFIDSQWELTFVTEMIDKLMDADVGIFHAATKGWVLGSNHDDEIIVKFWPVVMSYSIKLPPLREMRDFTLLSYPDAVLDIMCYNDLMHNKPKAMNLATVSGQPNMVQKLRDRVDSIPKNVFRDIISSLTRNNLKVASMYRNSDYIVTNLSGESIFPSIYASASYADPTGMIINHVVRDVEAELLTLVRSRSAPVLNAAKTVLGIETRILAIDLLAGAAAQVARYEALEIVYLILAALCFI